MPHTECAYHHLGETLVNILAQQSDFIFLLGVCKEKVRMLRSIGTHKKSELTGS